MKILLFKNKINWDAVCEICKVEDTLIVVPDGYIALKKSDSLSKNISATLKIYEELKIKLWLSFFYTASFELIDFDKFKIMDAESIKYQEIRLNHDMELLDKDFNIIDSLDFLKLYYEDAPSDFDFQNIFKVKHSITNGFRFLGLDGEAKNAENFLSNHVIQRYFLDAKSDVVPGVALEFQTPLNKELYYGYGRYSDYLTAKKISQLEAVERYASQYYAFNNSNMTLFRSFKEVEPSAIDPSVFLLEKNNTIGNDEKIYWTKAFSFKNKKNILVPEDLVYFGNQTIRRNYRRKINDSSNGVSLGGTYTEAMIGSLLELIERHSFLATWYGEIPGKEIKNYFSFLSSYLQESVMKLKESKVDVKLFEISQISGVYVVWALITDERQQATMYSYTAAGANVYLKQAIESALLESIVGFSVQTNGHKEMPNFESKVISMEDHLEYYGNKENKHDFDFTKSFNSQTFSIIGIKTFDTQEELLYYLIKKIYHNFSDVIFANLSSKEMESKNLYVTKALVPGMIPMTFGEDSLRISLEIINNIRKESGLEQISKIRKLAHPFP
ncbi:YcaO-like family protein [Leuconostoc citreum]|uniref:YcaO-like family protein n=1 Tax=Leuconostoc citreum TaxID=33964 RepID=UPI0032DF7CFE